MKKLLIILFIGLLFGCNSDDNNAPQYDTSVAVTLNDVAYGADPQQTMDVYLPAGRTNATKTVILIHGGAWIAGDKADFADVIPVIQAEFPDYAVININYRLATTTSPAYPKQIDDIELAIEKLKNGGYTISDDYAMLGASAGAHLAMLYAYRFDTNHEVKAIVDIVGPADFTDPQYLAHPLYAFAAQNLIGTSTPTAAQIQEVSPAAYITTQSAPTIMFYGGEDPLVPATQGPRLRDKLNQFGVYNEFNFYADGGHGDWDDATFAEVYTNLSIFLQDKFN
ncbi:MAG: alpha/beta hydrolase [Bacteroidota bacterium]